jgi:hypothetical protein
MPCNASYARLFLEGFLYARQIDMQPICTSMFAKKIFLQKVGVTKVLDAQGDDIEFCKRHTFALDYLSFIPVKRNQLANIISTITLLIISPMMRAPNITSIKYNIFHQFMMHA